MKIVTSALMILALAMPAMAQHHEEEKEKKNEVSVWVMPEGKVAPWYMYLGEKYVAQVRYGYDAESTLGLCAGHVLGSGEWKLVASGCSFLAGHKGFGPEIMVLGKTDKVSFFGQALYVFGRDHNPNFALGFVDLQTKVWKGLTAGLGGDIEYEGGDGHHHSETEANAGPAFGLEVHHVHFFVLPTFPLKGEQGKELTVGLRYVW